MKKEERKTKEPGKKKHLNFFHKRNRFFTGYLLKETEDFYTIELTSGVAGLNNIWYKGEIIMWGKDMTSIVKKKPVKPKKK